YKPAPLFPPINDMYYNLDFCNHAKLMTRPDFSSRAGTREWVGLKPPKPVVSPTFTDKQSKFWHDPFVYLIIVYHKPVKDFLNSQSFPNQLSFSNDKIHHHFTNQYIYNYKSHASISLIHTHIVKFHSGSTNASPVCIHCYTQSGTYI